MRFSHLWQQAMLGKGARNLGGKPLVSQHGCTAGTSRLLPAPAAAILLLPAAQAQWEHGYEGRGRPATSVPLQQSEGRAEFPPGQLKRHKKIQLAPTWAGVCVCVCVYVYVCPYR